MESVVHIGAKVDKDSSENLALAICQVLKAGHDNHSEQKTVRAALSILAKLCNVENVSLNGANINTGKTINIDLKDDEESNT